VNGAQLPQSEALESRTTRSGLAFSQWEYPVPADSRAQNKRRAPAEVENLRKKAKAISAQTAGDQSEIAEKANRKARKVMEVQNLVSGDRRHAIQDGGELDQGGAKERKPVATEPKIPKLVASRTKRLVHNGTKIDPSSSAEKENREAARKPAGPKLAPSSKQPLRNREEVGQNGVAGRESWKGAKPPEDQGLTSMQPAMATHARNRKRPRRQIVLPPLPPLEEL